MKIKDMINIIKAIDIHSHIGNILYPSGGDLIFRTGIKFPSSTGLQYLDEKNLYRDTFISKKLEKLFPMWATNCERKRNSAATLENFKISMLTVKTGIEIKYSVCLPIAPNNTYEDTRTAAESDPRIVPFTSPDFTSDLMTEKLMSDLNDGAAGVKIHPILQETPADSEEIMRAVETVSTYSNYIPVLFHAGEAKYYTPEENKKQFSQNASIDKIERVISSFPEINFIVGHAGLREIVQVMDLLSKYNNAYVDTSFQPPEAIKALVSSFGGEKVLFASDWPYGLRIPALMAVKEACGNDDVLLKAILFDNAAGILNLPFKIVNY